MMKRFERFLALLLLGVTAPAMAATQLTGAGSSFDAPFFTRAFYNYSQSHSDVIVNYASIGSGGGIAQFTAKTVDFGATDVPMNKDELAKAKEPVLQVPVALGCVAVMYNVLGAPMGLRPTLAIVADIFLGKVTKWNAGRILNLNKTVRLPDLPIVVAHRSDGSGTTYIFTDFLSSVSSEWKNKVGTGKTVQWPAASSVGGKGSEGLAGVVRNQPGAIGYVELSYVLQNHINTAAIQNQGGNFVNCALDTVRAAAAAKPQVKASNFSIVNQDGARSYPISGYSWVIVYKSYSDKVRARMIHDVLEYLVSSTTQQVAGSLRYVPLPENVQATAHNVLKEMQI